MFSFCQLINLVIFINVYFFQLFSVDDAKYLYHDGTSWKFGNVSMLKPEKFENLLFCTTCGQVKMFLLHLILYGFWYSNKILVLLETDKFNLKFEFEIGARRQ